MPDQRFTNNGELVFLKLCASDYRSHCVFKDLLDDLNRIKVLGVDVLWLMPVHPGIEINSQKSEKPVFAILDFLAINPTFGSKSDIYRLLNNAHDLGFKVMMDLAFNHIAKDAPLFKEHPEWFSHEFIAPADLPPSELSEETAFNFSNKFFSAFLIEVLQGWAAFGLDAFRYEETSSISQEFWEQAKIEVERIKPRVLWLRNDPALVIRK